MPGRLINAFLAEIARFDQAATASIDPDGVGPLESGYDDVYREVRTAPSDDDDVGTDLRQEWPLVQIPAQFHSSAVAGLFMNLKETVTGNVARSELQVLMHFDDLRRLNLVDEVSGMALIKTGDRLHAVYDLNGNLIQTILTPPGLYVTQALPIFGLGGARNLLEVSFDSRDTGQAIG